jgi:hypothetical protein
MMAVVSRTAPHESAVKAGNDWPLLSIAHNPVPVAISITFFGVSGNGATAGLGQQVFLSSCEGLLRYDVEEHEKETGQITGINGLLDVLRSLTK